MAIINKLKDFFMNKSLSNMKNILTYATLTLGSCWLLAGNVLASSPSFDCQSVEVGSIEDMVCKDDELAALDRKLADVYASARQIAVNEHPPILKAEQRGWIKGRNDCWKSSDRRKCVEESYRLRIAEIQARYRLIPVTDTVRYVCDGNPSNEVIATFFQTDPPTLIAERGDSVSMMYLQPSGSGAKYQGRNEILWEHHGEARIVWGYDAPEMNCQKMPMELSRILPGSPVWRQEVERLVGTSDGAGHGPDIGSEEWMYTVSRKLGIDDSQGHGPDPGSDEWKNAVHRLVFKSEPDN